LTLNPLCLSIATFGHDRQSLELDVGPYHWSA